MASEDAACVRHMSRHNPASPCVRKRLVMKFADMRLSGPILRAVQAEGYTIPTPIQVQAIPPVLEGHDVLGCAQTGTGKTAAFALPILHRLTHSRAPVQGKARAIRVLVLAPTRELAAQITESFRAYGRNTPLRHAVIFGGVSQASQVHALREGIDILVATPGRLLDLMGQGYVDLRRVEVLVLDEADRMLDMGFIHDIRKIVAKVPTERQTLLFSATIPADICDLADFILRKPVNVNVAPSTLAADTVEQCVYFVEKASKPAMLEHFLNTQSVERALVFTRTKHGADRVVKHLMRAGIRAEAIHGNKSQNARTRAITGFKSGSSPVLVATDIASRGLDIDEVSHVINYDVPNLPETYVHRIGRTGRAGASGEAVSFCDQTEKELLRDIERLIRKRIPVGSDCPQLPPSGGRPPEEGKRPQRQVASPVQRQRTPRAGSSHRSVNANPPATRPQEQQEVQTTGSGGLQKATRSRRRYRWSRWQRSGS
jgi:ATP-dependent RNA helicase RhlE